MKNLRDTNSEFIDPPLCWHRLQLSDCDKSFGTDELRFWFDLVQLLFTLFKADCLLQTSGIRHDCLVASQTIAETVLKTLFQPGSRFRETVVHPSASTPGFYNPGSTQYSEMTRNLEARLV